MKKIDGFIIEGADQQGKSTICKYIQKKLRWKIVHFPPPHKDFDFFDDYLVEPKTICDRNFPSELAYSKLNGRPHRIKHLSLLMQHFINMNFVIIVLDRGDNQELLDRDELYSKEQIKEVHMIYRRLVPFGAMKTYFMDPVRSLPNIDKLIEKAR